MSDAAPKADNVVCQLTSVGRSAVAAIWVSGPLAEKTLSRFFQAKSKKKLDTFPPRRIIYGSWQHAQGPEDVVVIRRDAQSFEVHCHGGLLASHLILEALQSHGFRPVDSFDVWTRIVGDPWQAAAQDAVQHALTIGAADRLLLNADGRWKNTVDDLRRGLAGAPSVEVLIPEVQRLCKSHVLGRRILKGWTVVIAGRPNVGKSSLVNRLVGYARSLVFDQPGTTRDVIRQITAIGGWPVLLSDTAGLRSSIDTVESIGIRAARETIASADFALWVSDLSQPWSNEDQSAVEDDSRCLLIHNKTDLAFVDDARPPGIRVSLLHDANVDEILSAIEGRICATVPPETSPFLVRPWQSEALEQIVDCLARNDREMALQILEHPDVDSRHF